MAGPRMMVADAGGEELEDGGESQPLLLRREQSSSPRCPYLLVAVWIVCKVCCRTFSTMVIGN